MELSNCEVNHKQICFITSTVKSCLVIYGHYHGNNMWQYFNYIYSYHYWPQLLSGMFLDHSVETLIIRNVVALSYLFTFSFVNSFQLY